MKKHSKKFKIMLSAVIVLVIVLATAATCFADGEASMPFQAEVFVNGSSIGNCTTIQDFNKLLTDNPGSGDMLVKSANRASWHFWEPIVIPAGAEYRITFKMTDSTRGWYFKRGCGIRVEADNVSLDFGHGPDFSDTYQQNEYGGLIYVTGDNFTLKNIDISGTSAKYHGGAIYTEGNNTTIENCTFSNCTAEEYGGAIYAKNYGCKIKGCTFKECTAKGGWAGAVYLNYGGKSKKDLALIENCDFNNCSANGGYGEALFLGYDFIHVKGCQFYNTTVTDDICYVGIHATDDVRFDNCDFKSNKAAEGYDEFVDIWGTKGYTVVQGCTSENPNEDRFYHCNVDPNASGAVISSGNLWIVIVGGVVVLGGIAAIIIVSKKKKKKA